MKAEERRKNIALVLGPTTPISGGALSKRFGVSRQIIVQDIALLKAAGYEIIATHTGYILQRSPLIERAFKVLHSTEQTEDELATIVELGGTVADVYVRHKMYGKLSASLNIFSKAHIKQFIDKTRSENSTELMSITGGQHYHTVYAENEQTLDQIQAALQEKGYLICVE